MQLEQRALADIRLDVREALENRARLLTELGYHRVDGEWCEKRSGEPITNQEIREIYRIGNDNTPRSVRDSRWPWPSTHVPF